MAASQRAEHGNGTGPPQPQRMRLVSVGGNGTRRPNLFVNPLSDAVFAQQTADLVTRGTARPEELAAQLRPSYPNVVARKRDISGEAESWYVYRDGHWVEDEPSIS